MDATVMGDNKLRFLVTRASVPEKIESKIEVYFNGELVATVGVEMMQFCGEHPGTIHHVAQLDVFAHLHTVQVEKR